MTKKRNSKHSHSFLFCFYYPEINYSYIPRYCKPDSSSKREERKGEGQHGKREREGKCCFFEKFLFWGRYILCLSWACLNGNTGAGITNPILWALIIELLMGISESTCLFLKPQPHQCIEASRGKHLLWEVWISWSFKQA